MLTLFPCQNRKHRFQRPRDLSLVLSSSAGSRRASCRWCETGLVRAHLGTAEFKTSFEFGSSSPSCPPFPWSGRELGTCPSWNLGSTLPCVSFQKKKGTEPVNCRRPPHKVTKRRKKVKISSLKTQDKIFFLSFPCTVLCYMPSASTF